MATRQPSTRLRAASKPLHSPRDAAFPTAASSASPRDASFPTAATSAPPSGNSGCGVCSAPLAIFLANLRLLDLDTLPDWPDISPQTFSTSSAGAQSQKRRIQCVEWALFRLFSLWDPQESANKLKPFFPPLDQIQSINLRAALLRALEQAKKNGALGRDAVIRKTMLDECKGERLEETLASFSSAVLKNQIASDAKLANTHPAAAVQLAYGNWGANGSPQTLYSLILAHKGSLRRFLEDKAVLRSRYSQFAALLRDKRSEIDRQNAELCAAKQNVGIESLSSTSREETRRMLRHNWTGDDRWIKTLLLGDAQSSCPNMFSVPFDKIWRQVEHGEPLAVDQDGGGILAQLESHTQQQQQRLDKLMALCSDGRGEAKDAASSSPRASRSSLKGNGLDFSKHLHLQIGCRVADDSNYSQKQPVLVVDDERISHRLSRALTRINSRSVKLPGFLARHKSEDANEEEDVDSVHDADSIREETLDDAPSWSPRRIEATLGSDTVDGGRKIYHRDVDFHETRTRDSSLYHDAVLRDCSNASHKTLDGLSQPHSLDDNQNQRCQAGIPLRDEYSAPHRAPKSSKSKFPSPGQSTEPLKPQSLSLAQRARLSMSKPNNIPPKHVPISQPSTISNTLPSAEASHENRASNENRPYRDTLEYAQPSNRPCRDTLEHAQPSNIDDLLSRTRRSMVGSEKAKMKAQMERRNSLRRSRIPARGESAICPTVDEANEQSTLAEELMQEEDMEAVFRSRPKIKASPVASPTK